MVTTPSRPKINLKQFKNIIEKPLKFDEDLEITEECKNLIKQMLVKDPKNRINMFKILNHKWFEMTDTEIDNAQYLSAQAKMIAEKLKDQQLRLVKKKSISNLTKESINYLDPKFYNRSTRLDSFNRMIMQSTNEISEVEDARK